MTWTKSTGVKNFIIYLIFIEKNSANDTVLITCIEVEYTNDFETITSIILKIL